MNRILIKLLFVTTYSLVSLFTNAQDTTISDSQIKKSIKTFANLMDTQHLKQFGLTSKDEFKSLKVGKQFKNYMIALNDIKNFKQGDDVNKIILEYPSIEVALVSSTGKIVTSIEFVKNHGKWEASGYGSTPELIMLSRVQGIVGDTFIKVGKLIRIPTLRISFIAIGSGSQLEFISLDDRVNLKLDKNQKLAASDAILKLVPLAKKHTGLPN
jgi:hypothetical protein